MSTQRARGIESAQGVVVLVAITLGIIPVVQVLLFDGNPGLLTVLLPDAPSASHWAVPLSVLAVSVMCVFAFESAKKRR